ncbi:MAG TPA: hypothetical protein VHX65_05265 [Pirellulales bacterium]|jgi:hypothetical protein|nr:hypothetical protein [Pirellulales bacterium]
MTTSSAGKAKVTSRKSGGKPVDLFSRHPRGHWCERVAGKLLCFIKIAPDKAGGAALDRGARKSHCETHFRQHAAAG